jgi:hypothetical protein
VRKALQRAILVGALQPCCHSECGLLVAVPAFFQEPKLTCTGADCSVLVVRESVLKMKISVYIGS